MIEAVTGCHSCGSHELTIVPTVGLKGVTSDSRPWERVSALATCLTCGLIQKVIDEAWRDDARRIYSSYDIYHQSGGAEQLVFEAERAPAPRSARVLRAFADRNPLGQRGSMLDIGCGNGALLRTFAGLFPAWDLWGSELNDRKRSLIENIPGVRKLYVGDISEIDRTFDVVSLMHVLEHVESPRAFLRHIRERITQRGHLLVQVPDASENPFDLLVADHASHFTARSASRLLRDTGFEVAAVPPNLIAKELTLEARPAVIPAGDGQHAGESDIVRHAVDWLRRVKTEAIAASGARPFGLFGTSIAGTWLTNEIGAAVTFFVDEDPDRIGRTHLGRPILAPDSIPSGSLVYIALVPAAASDVAGRLRTRSFGVRTPPAWTGHAPGSPS